MKKIAEVLSEIDSVVKSAFIPNPNVVEKQQQSQQQQGPPPAPEPGTQGGPLGHAGTQGAGDPSAILAQLPPEVQQQIAQLPPDQQQMALQQLMGAGAAPGEGESGGQGSQIQSSGPPTDLEKSTVTLRLRDLLDLVSGGNATKSTLKVQEHYSKQQMKQQQIQMKQQQEQQKQEMEAQMQQQQQAAQGPNIMGGGGIY